MKGRIVVLDVRVDELFQRYRDLQTYVDWTEADADLVRQSAPLVEDIFQRKKRRRVP